MSTSIVKKQIESLLNYSSNRDSTKQVDYKWKNKEFKNLPNSDKISTRSLSVEPLHKLKNIQKKEQQDRLERNLLYLDKRLKNQNDLKRKSIRIIKRILMKNNQSSRELQEEQKEGINNDDFDDDNEFVDHDKIFNIDGNIKPILSLDISSSGIFDAVDTNRVGEEKFHFEAEINKLMGIFVNSLYSNSDVFLRELVSNAIDALEKQRFLLLTKEKESDLNGRQLEVRIFADKERKLLHIHDNGVGMTQDELKNNIGRIAKSGASDFVKKIVSKNTDSKGDGDNRDLISQIGNFGVGFYSAFLVADKVTLVTKSDDSDDQYIWQSESSDPSIYTVSKDPRGNTLGRGTVVTLHLREETSEYLNEDKLEGLIKSYSDFLGFPIYLHKRVSREVEKDTESAEGDADSDSNQKQEEIKVEYEWIKVNTQKPLWTRSSKEITKEEYSDFYRTFFNDGEELFHLHFKFDGENSFTCLLFIPDNANIMMDYAKNFKVYVKRVLIKDDADGIVPRYLNFIHGIIDSDDIPVSVSREVLQKSTFTKSISKKIVNKVLTYLSQISKSSDPEDQKQWDKFYSLFSTNLKVGIIEDSSLQRKLSRLVRYNTLKHPEELISLESYVSDMEDDQNKIYYLAGESIEAIKASPLLESMADQGYDVLLLTAPIDEYALARLRHYESENTKKIYTFADVSKEDIKLKDTQEDLKEKTKKFKPLLDFILNMKELDLKSTRLTSRLKDTPVVIVTDSGGLSANTLRIARSQYIPAGSEKIRADKILELNPNHPIVAELLSLVENDRIDLAKKNIELLVYSSLIATGHEIEEPVKFSKKINEIVAENLDISSVIDQDLGDEL